MLTIEKALELHELLSPHLPEYVDDSLDYVGEIVMSMETDPDTYIASIMMMSGLDQEEIVEKSIENILELFVSGLGENNIIGLRKFCITLGLNYDQ